MTSRWSPHPRYRLYTTGADYCSVLFDTRDAIENFEYEVCRRFDVAAAVCVPMARVGLYLAVREMIRPGQKVILSPLTIVDVVNAVLLAGGVPVFADIVRRSCAMDIERADSLIDGSTAALLVTHLHGETAGAHAFLELCRRRGVCLIEDSAQAFGAIERGKRLGTIGDAGIYSFGLYKNLTTWRGGMVVSNNVELIERIRRHVRKLTPLPKLQLLIRMLGGLLVDAATYPSVFAAFTHPLVRRNFGIINRRLDPELGAMRSREMPADHLRRMRESQARIGIRHLELVDQDAFHRIEHAAKYHDGLGGLEGVITPQRGDDLSNIYTYFPIQASNRDSLLEYSQKRRRDFAAQHLRNCADLPMFAEFRRDCPNARRAACELVLLPTYPRYPASEVRKNIEVIREFIQGSSDGAAKETPGGVPRT
jgi:perosamine synthetase